MALRGAVFQDGRADGSVRCIGIVFTTVAPGGISLLQYHLLEVLGVHIG